MRRALLLLAGAALAVTAACAALRDYHAANPDFGTGVPPYEPIRFAASLATDAERARCAAAGGTVERGGLLGWEHCVQTFADAGKACSGSADCIGDCRVPDSAREVAPGTPVQGVCQATDSPFGCYATVEGGVAGAFLCVD